MPRIVSVSVVALVLLVSLLSVSSPALAGGGYPAELENVPQASRADYWGFLNRECTSWVAYRLNSVGIQFKNDMNGGRFGNAYEWKARAIALGWGFDTTPSVGAIAYWGSGEAGAFSGGHVAYVERVNSNGSQLISEYNWGKVNGETGRYAERDNCYAPHFIHIKNVTPAPVPPSTSYSIPQLLSSADGITIQQNQSATFSWSNTGASQYKIEAWNDTGSGSLSTIVNGTSTQFAPANTGSWRWQVRSMLPNGQPGDAPPTRSFTVTQSASASPPSSGSGILLFDGENYSGDSKLIPVGKTSDLNSVGFWDRAESVKFVGDCAGGKAHAVLYSEKDFQGDPGHYDNDSPTLGNAQKNHVRSVEIYMHTTPAPVVTTYPMPQLLSPADGITIQQNQSITFSWSNTGASQYKIEAWNDTGSGSLSTIVNGTSTQFAPANIGSWRWQVRSMSSNGQPGDAPPTRSFTVASVPKPPTTIPEAPPPPPSYLSPSHYVTVNSIPTISWRNNGGTSATFSVILSHNNQNVQQSPWITGTSWQPTGPLDPGGYAWHVLAKNQSGVTSDASPLWSNGVSSYGDQWWEYFSYTPSATTPTSPSLTGSIPVISSVSSISQQQSQTIIIKGSGFGNHDPYNGDSPYIEISDITSGWNAGYIEANPAPGAGDTVTLNVVGWTDGQVNISGFTGLYGNGFILSPGDTIRVRIWQIPTLAGPATYLTTCALDSGSPPTSPIPEAPPPPPSYLSPSHYATVNSIPTISWRNNGGTSATFSVILSHNNQNVQQSPWITGTSWQPTGPLDPGGYAWHVLAKNQSGITSDASPLWSNGVSSYGDQWWEYFSYAPDTAAASPVPTTPPAPVVPPPPPSPSAGTASAYFDPPIIGTKSGSEFTLNVGVKPDGRGLSAGELILSFPPDAMEVTSYEPGQIFGTNPLVGIQKLDSSSGSLQMTLGRSGPTIVPTAPGTLLTVHFRIKNGVGQSDLQVKVESLSLSDERFLAANVSLPASAIVHVSSAMSVMIGDASGDGVVDYRDLAMLGSAYGTRSGETGFDPRVDFNGDGVVDYRDLALLGANYGHISQ